MCKTHYYIYMFLMKTFFFFKYWLVPYTKDKYKIYVILEVNLNSNL